MSVRACAVPAITAQRPAASSTATSYSRMRSGSVSSGNSPNEPVRVMPWMPSPMR